MSGSADPDTGRTGGAIKRRVKRGRPSADRQLKASLDAALAAASRELGGRLEWSEQEQLILDRAAAAADRDEQIQQIYEACLAAGAEPGVLVKLSAEIRARERAVVDLVGKVNVGVGAAKSEQHVKAARARWDRREPGWPPPGFRASLRANGLLDGDFGGVDTPREAGRVRDGRFCRVPLLRMSGDAAVA